MANHESRPDVIRFGVFELDLPARELRKQGRRVRLQDKPFELLAALVERPGEIVTRDDLCQRLWPADTYVVFDDNLNAAVRKVREALNDSADAPRFVETVPRRGYRFIAPVNGTAATASEPEPVVAPRRARRSWWLAVAIGVIALVAVVSIVRLTPNPPADALTAQLEIRAPEGTYFPAFAPRTAISPDGRMIAFLAGTRQAGEHQLWLRRLDALDAEPVRGTNRAFYPCWSPRSDALAFPALGKLRRLDLDTREVVPLADAMDAGPATWSIHDDILFTGPHEGLMRVRAEGGPAERVTTPDRARGERSHYFPHFLPDGRSYLYFVNGDSDAVTGVYLGRLGRSDSTHILVGTSHAEYVAPGYLVYVRDGELFAQRFDTARGAFEGEAIGFNVSVSQGDKGMAQFSVSPRGVLAYSPLPNLPTHRLVWFDRAGRRLRTVGDPAVFTQFDLSPDERWVALQRTEPPPKSNLSIAPDIWMLDAARGVAAQVTVNPANDAGPVWAPDSRRFVYARHRGIQEPSDIYLRTRGDTADQPLLATEESEYPSDWSADGRFILFQRHDAGRNSDLWVLSLEPEPSSRLWLGTPAHEWQARFSPDGRWVAYTSNETGRPEVYVRSFQGNGPKRRISNAGGASARWNRDGSELFYVSGARELMRVPVRRGVEFETGSPEVLFQLHRVVSDVITQACYEVAADGRSFLVVEVVTEPGEPPIAVLVNWSSALADRSIRSTSK